MMKSALAFVCILGCFISKGFAHPNMCLKPTEEIKTAFENCKTKLGVEPKNMGKPEDNNYDDQCMTNCGLQERKLVNSDGDILDDAFKAAIRAHAEASGKTPDAFVGTAMDCVTAARAEYASSGGVKANACKFASKLFACIYKEHEKIC